jgi:hypothetical protein
MNKVFLVLFIYFIFIYISGFILNFFGEAQGFLFTAIISWPMSLFAFNYLNR